MEHSLDSESSPLNSSDNLNRSSESASENVDRLIERIRSRLRPDGPEVDYEMLYAYIDDDLPDEEARKNAQQLIYTWKSWHDAYWKIRAELDFNQTDLPLDETE